MNANIDSPLKKPFNEFCDKFPGLNWIEDRNLQFDLNHYQLPYKNSVLRASQGYY